MVTRTYGGNVHIIFSCSASSSNIHASVPAVAQEVHSCFCVCLPDDSIGSFDLLGNCLDMNEDNGVSLFTVCLQLADFLSENLTRANETVETCPKVGNKDVSFPSDVSILR